MVIDFAAYRRKQVQHPSWVTDAVQQELVCVNWEGARVITVKPVDPVAPLASPPLPTTDEDLAAFQALAYALATQV
ncbi:MAG: hypothetical protein ACM3SS_12050 [Rhodospirillaceae bacterium]